MNKFWFIRADVLAGIDELRGKLITLMESADAIQANADKGKRELTAAEKTQIDNALSEFEVVKAEITRRERMAASAAHLETVQPRVTRSAEISSPSDDKLKNKAGYSMLGAFCADARKAQRGIVSDKFGKFLNALPSSYGSEGANADGGYAVPIDYRESIVNHIYAEDALIARTDQYTTSSNAITMPVDETTAWGTTGVQAYWESEAGQITTSKLKLGSQTIRAHKLAALVPVTDELLEDVASMTGYLQSKIPGKFAFAINDALINGVGSDRPMGIMNSPAKVTVGAVSGQGAGTIVLTNVVKMWGRRYIGNQQNYVWLINQDAEQQLQQMVLSGTAVWPAYMPPGGLSGAQYATLYGKPVIVMESCAALGTEGDIILADMSQYMTVLKSGGMRQDVSVHLWFDYDITAFRFTIRLGGQGWWTAALARKNSSNTVSPFITLNSTRT